MGFFSGLLETRGQDFFDLILSARGIGLETATGKTITVHNSLQYSAVFAAQRILSEDTASLPLILYRRLQPRGKERATNHRLFNILHRQANPEMTAYELRELLVSHTAMWGNGYCEIQRDRGGRVLALWPLRPDRVDVQRGWDGLLYYQVTIGNPLEHDPETMTLPARNVMHVRGLGYDGIKGYSVIGLARQSIGLGLATEEFGARFFGNGARPGAVLEHPGKLTDTAFDRLKKSWNVRHQGLENAHRLAILEEGMKIHEIGIPPEDAQFLETRKFQVTEIARWFRIPPHMLADLERSTNNNIEHQSLEYVMHSLRPWFVRIEQRVGHDLLTETEGNQGYFAEHLVDAFLRGDITSRYSAYGVGRQNGWLSANDIREMENMNPVEGGDVYLVPLNMVPANEVGGAVGEREARAWPPEQRGRAEQIALGRQRLAASYRRLLEDAAGRVVRREVNDIRRAVQKFLGKRTAAEFREWLEQFYAEHQVFLAAQFLPILLTYAEQIGLAVDAELGIEAQDPAQIRQFIDEYVAALAAREAGSGLGQLRALLDEALASETDPEPALNQRLDEWAETKPGKISKNEANRAGNGIAKAFYLLAGVQFLRWVASGETCPYCRNLDGRVMGIREVFLGKETDFEPEGAERPIRVRSDISHPPLHRGCDCTIVASL